MRFLFINPPNRKLINDVNKAVFPLGIAYLGASLLENKVEVEILDAVIEDIDHHFAFQNRTYYGLDLEGIRNEIVNYKPDVVGVSFLFTPVSEISKEICSIAKACKAPYTAVGGPIPSALPNLFITSLSVDFVFIGESERTITKFAETIDQGNDHDLSALDGFVCKDKDGNVVHNPKTSFIQNLDEIFFPARHLLPMEKYLRVSSPQGGVHKTGETHRSSAQEDEQGNAAFVLRPMSGAKAIDVDRRTM